MPKRPPTHKPPWKNKLPPKQDTVAEDEKRKNAYQRGYNAQWRKLRAIHLSEYPLCRFCLKEGRTTKAAVVDHIKPHRGDRRLLYDPNNLQSLCKHHHDRDKQLIEHGKQALRWGVDGLPIKTDS
jgi:5-methylcytosine-specific restriction protein A